MRLMDLRQDLVALLTENGIHAVAAWQNGPRLGHTRPVAAVSLQALACSTPFRHLRSRLDPETGEDQALYGQQLQLSYSIQLYAPRNDPEGCLSLFDQIAQVLALEMPETLALGSLSCGAVSYDRDTDLLTCTAVLQGSTWLCTVYRESGERIDDFIVKGTMV